MRVLPFGLPKTVLILGLVSFFTDLSSEMIYPLLPIFLASAMGAGAAVIGIIEGIAETTAAFFKLMSGIWTDRLKRRKPFILSGYGISGVARPLIGLAGAWPVVMFLRFADRMGKGVRTSPRDALIADAVGADKRGEAYGFHRAMDHAGAVIGPLVAAALLSISGMKLQTVFLLSAVPGGIVLMLILFGIRERNPGEKPDLATVSGVGSDPAAVPVAGDPAKLDRNFKTLLAAIFLFTLGNSTDAFILLRLSDAGLPPTRVAILWSIHHVIKMISTYAAGRISDRFGRRSFVLSGWMLYAAIYLLFGYIDNPNGLVAVFLCYGIYFGLTEPCEKAWVADLAPSELRGSAFGYYHATIGFGALPASLVFGFLWQTCGVSTAFYTGATLAGLASVMILFVGSGKKNADRSS